MIEEPTLIPDLPMGLVDVAIPTRVHGSFHYKASESQLADLQIGSVVEVFFRNKATHAVVLGFPEKSDVAETKLKAVERVLFAEPLLDEQTFRFLKWTAEYYCHPLGDVMTSALPKQYFKLTDARRKKIEALAADDKGLAEMGLTASAVPKPVLTDEQAKAVDGVWAETRPVLLQGVTGSGKTEVYMAVLEKVLAEGRGAIVLVPEIALTPQLLGRFSSRFPGKVAVLHSDITPKERFVQWERIRKGIARVVVGARSAVFAPLRDIGLIVVDEEHETSYKQEDSLRYHARDLAVVRAKLCGARVVLGSATPSLESYYNSRQGKYAHIRLLKRVMERPMPKTTFVDLRVKEAAYSYQHPWLSKVLVSKMNQALTNGHQVMLFLNRLGFAHFLFCADCGHTWRCKNCDVALTYYRYPPLLKCHYCAVEIEPPCLCSECQGNSLKELGLGTEQVEASIKEIFPKARTARMDRSVIKTRKDLEDVLNAIVRREVDIVVGTQMIAKGHDFPGIALVGILVADASLNQPDFRAYERTFQILTQVSGRAGRAEVAGEVVIQTLNPDHPVLQAAAEHRDEDFFRSELAGRERFGFPPFQRLAMIRFQHSNAAKVEQFAQSVAAGVRETVKKHGWQCEVTGPAEAPIAKIKNLYRWHCMVKGGTVRELQSVLRIVQDYAERLKYPVQMAIDVDPVSSL